MEVRPEWAKCCCCKLSVSKTSGRLKWCADSEKWKSSKWLKLMLALTVVLLPVAVVSLSVIKYTYSSQKQANAAPSEFDRSTLENNEIFTEGSRSYIIRDLHKTNCFPAAKGYYSVRNKRNLFHHAYEGNSSEEDENMQLFEDEDNRPVTASTRRNARNRNYYQDSHSKSEDLINVLHDDEKNDEIEAVSEVTTADNLYNKTDRNHRHFGRMNKEAGEKIQFNFSQIIEQSFWRFEWDKETTRKAQAKLMMQYMDFRTDPCEDFYQYACGNWGKMNPIPKDRPNFDTFEKLRESLDYVLKELLEEKISDEDISAYKKAKQFYRSCINYEILEKRGVQPLTDLLNSLGGWPIITPNWNSSKFDWLELMANLRLYNNDILISEWVGPDIKNSDEYVIQFDQTSLGLPTRDYYLLQSNHMYIEAYKNYLTKIASLIGASSQSAGAHADEIIAFETELAKITSAPDERRNVSGLYQRMTVAALKASIPQVDWQRYLTIVLNRSCNDDEPVVIFALRYVQDLVSLLHRTHPRTIANYLLWRFVRHRVNNLDDRFQEAKQQFYFTLLGREKSPPRWKYCVTQTNTNMGMALGAMFVQKYFDENSKNDTLSMTKEIQQAFVEILQETNWLGSKTKSMASEKVETMILKVGYPDLILSSNLLNDRFQDVEIHPEEYFENTLNLLRHMTRAEQSHLGTAVNKSIWNTAPAVVNAYYSRNKNQIMFPAGILQPPFYHRHFPRSLNYGGIGVVIGHEITHGFDDKGRLFDKHGNLHRWWKDEEINTFRERARCLIEQYGKYIVQEVGISLDGINTQGENIADNGGIRQAFRAYQRWLNINGNEEEMLPGLNATEYQLFFLNFAQVWCGNMRPEASKNGLKTAVHSPGRFRVIGTLSNNPEFARTFQCPLGTPMNPLKKCSVW